MFLASSDQTIISRSEIGEATQVPQDYLTKVMRELDRRGIVKSQRGRGGGYTLVSSPDKLTVFDVVDAVSHLPRIDSCPLGVKEHIQLCPLHRRLDDAAAMVEKAFRETTISELVPATAPGHRPNPQCQFPTAD